MNIHNLTFSPLLLAAIFLWTFVITGIALWRSARNKHGWWFIIFLTIHTVGLLEIVYLVAHRKKKKGSKPSNKNALSQLTDPSATPTTRREAILYVLIGILDEHHQLSISQAQLDIAVQAIEQRIDGSITQKQLQSILDKPLTKDGAGLYKQTADRVATHFESIVQVIKKGGN